MRHAKSSWAIPGARDFDRELNERGWSDLKKISGVIREHAILPELILCSSSQRTRQTLDGIKEAFSEEPEIKYLEEFYSGGMQDYIDTIKSVSGKKSIMTIGHNPMSGSLANALATDGDEVALQTIAQKYPTSAIAILEFDVSEWSDLEKSSGTLSDFIYPSKL